MRKAYEIFQQFRETEDSSLEYTRRRLELEVLLDVRDLLLQLVDLNKNAEERLVKLEMLGEVGKSASKIDK